MKSAKPHIRQYATRKPKLKVSTAVLFLVGAVALVHQSLYWYFRSHAPTRSVVNVTTRDAAALSEHRFILFDGDLAGQGLGNIVSGLLAAHLLGQEFHRIVCILPSYQSFLEVFEPSHALAVTLCPGALQDRPRRARNNQFRLVNYDAAPNECTLQELLQSAAPVLYMVGNTYPRWPPVPDRFFFQHYRPKPILLEALSLIHSTEIHTDYQHALPFTTVVHLRSPDSSSHRGDVRKGLDPESLTALGQALPHGPTTYLVTNRVAYYQQFVDCCQWSHPPWSRVIHSANGKTWGSLPSKDTNHSPSQNVQMWVDWYALLIAPTVYHTHSDFSNSAIHWMNNRQSYSLVGSTTSTEGGATLRTQAESW